MKRVSSIDVINLLKEYKMNKKPIKAKDGYLYFGVNKFPMQTETGLLYYFEIFSPSIFFYFLDNQFNLFIFDFY